MSNAVKKRLSSFTLFSLILSFIVLVTGFFPYPEGPEEIVIFIGRFHPLIVHMPIGFITAVVILQLVALVSRSDLRLGIGVLLWVTMISAILAAIIGTLLALPGGYDDQLLEQHRKLGIGTSIVCIWMLNAHRSKRRGSGLLYSGSLLICLGLVGATGHVGGSLTHGHDYLTAYLPPALGGKMRPEPVDPGTKEDAAIYDRVIQPILDNKCVACHSLGKNKGELRMVDLEALLTGGKRGPTLVEGSAAESLMIQRVQLPLDHKEHMPPQGKVQLGDAELELLSWWIDQGASQRMSLDTQLPSDDAVALLESALGFVVAEPKLPMLSWEEAVKASAPLHDNHSLRIRRVALDSAALQVSFEPSKENIDAVIAQLTPFKANITLLDLGNTPLSSAALEQIGTFRNLEELNLQNTTITDDDMVHLENLRQLNKINLYGTTLSDAALVTLRNLPRLRQVVLWKTQVSYDAAEAFKADMVNEGKRHQLQTALHELENQLASMEVDVVGIEKIVIDKSQPSVALFNKDSKKYGIPLADKSQVTVSSTTQFDPPGGLLKLTQAGPFDKAFAFHTAAENNPWVRFRFDQPITLNAMSINNRDDVKERAEGLTLQSSNSSGIDYSLSVTNTANTQLTEYPLDTLLSGRYVVMRISGKGKCNPGGSELVLGNQKRNDYRNRVLELKPTAYYSFDPEDSINATALKNLGSLTNTASLTGGATLSGISGGIHGGSLNIDDNSKQVLLVNAGGIDLKDDWTLSTWFQDLHDTDGYRTLTRAQGDGNDHQVIVNQKSDDLGLFNNHSTDGLPHAFQDSDFDLISGDKKWHHLTAVGTGGDAGQTDFYIDGVHVGTADQGSSGNIAAIGNYQGGGQPFAQGLDEFAVFDRALKAEEIVSLATIASHTAENNEVTMLADPISATASSEFSKQYAIDFLYDGKPTLHDLNTKNNIGKDYAGKGGGPHVVVYDMGSKVTFDRIFYAQRPFHACDKTQTIDFWVSDSDPGIAATTMPILSGSDWKDVFTFPGVQGQWDIDLTEISLENRKAQDFRLVIPKEGAILHLQKVLMWGEILPQNINPSEFDRKKTKFGTKLTTQAKVTVSSRSEYEPPNALKALVQDKDNDLPFAIHTEHEDKPWVQFSYDQPLTLNGLHIVNRKDDPDRARGLRLESSPDAENWTEVWVSKEPEPIWSLDLTAVPEKQRKAKNFRLIIPYSATLNLSQVRLWGKLAPPTPSAGLFNANKKKYGELISQEAKVTLSSNTQHSPPDGLEALTQQEDNELPFAFHTNHEVHPWVQLSYDHPMLLNALIIRNRGNLQERADGLALERSNNGSDWELVWKSSKIESTWPIDLTKLPKEKRTATAFRLILLKAGLTTLHLGQLHLWGLELEHPEPKAPTPVAGKPVAPVAVKPAAPVPAKASVPTGVPSITGQGDWIYRALPEWGKVPGHDHIGSTHGGIVVDQSGKVYVSTDGPNGMIVYHPDGTFIKSFGPQSKRYHGLNIYREQEKEFIYAAAMSHVLKMDLDGKVVLKIDGQTQAPENQWKKATAVAVAPNGDIFIADGYGSSVIFKYDQAGTFIKKFGLRGRKDGEFITSHGLALDNRNPERPLLIVCDRENKRLQHFDLDGNFIKVAINGLRRPCALSIWDDYMVVAELAGRAVILDKEYKIVSILGDNPDPKQHANFGVAPEHWHDGVFTAPHGCSFDHEGNLYIQDWNKWGRITKMIREK